MPDAKSRPGKAGPAKLKSAGVPQAALDALLADAAERNPVRRALWLDALDLRLRPHLPPMLAAHARLANVDGGKLVFLVDSPVWHARLRLAADQLLDAARSIGLDVTRVVVRTTQQRSPAPRPAAPAPVSAVARAALDDALALLRPDDRSRGMKPESDSD